MSQHTKGPLLIEQSRAYIGVVNGGIVRHCVQHDANDLQIDPGLGAGLGTPSAARLMPGGGGGCDGLPAVHRAYNLYQPYDPIAYRCMPAGVTHLGADACGAFVWKPSVCDG